MSRCSAFSPNYEGRSPFSPNYKGRSAFSKISKKQSKTAKLSLHNNDDDIYREILEKNAILLKKIKQNLESYQKNKDDKERKKKAFESCEKDLRKMHENIRCINISFDEFYTDTRKQIVKDIKEAQQTLEILK